MAEEHKNCVVQDWLSNIPLRMQSVLLLGLRGPDTHKATEVKKFSRWLRGLVFVPGNPDNVAEFMRVENPPLIVEKSDVAKELEFCTQHYYSHLMHALEVVAYCHPDPKIKNVAFIRFEQMCLLLHLPVESSKDFHNRLGMRAWPGIKQPRTAEEAFEQVRRYGTFSANDQAILRREYSGDDNY